MARRQHVTAMFALAVMALITLSYMLSSSSAPTPRIRSPDEYTGAVLSGGVIAPKLENATAKCVPRVPPAAHC